MKIEINRYILKNIYYLFIIFSTLFYSINY